MGGLKIFSKFRALFSNFCRYRYMTYPYVVGLLYSLHTSVVHVTRAFEDHPCQTNRKCHFEYLDLHESQFPRRRVILNCTVLTPQVISSHCSLSYCRYVPISRKFYNAWPDLCLG